LAVLVALYIAVEPNRPTATFVEGGTGEAERAAQVLEDLELDYETGKISQADHDFLRNNLRKYS
jgi:hypothetical protein